MRLSGRLGFGLLVICVVASALPVPSALAKPSDPFTGASPSFDAAPKEGVNYDVGDWGVAEQRGAATYTFPISVPPGRNGMAPALALRYSSASPLRGGVAVGWTLDIPSIQRDSSLGADGGLHYRASLGSVTGRLVEVPDDIPLDNGDAAYRVNFDDSYTRFFRRATCYGRICIHHWTALTPDGVKHHFEPWQNASDLRTRWYVTKQEDPFGNTVKYFWSAVTAPDESTIIDYSLDRIEYTSNANAELDAHAMVAFEYAPLEVCSGSPMPMGAATRRGSLSVDGARRLTDIKTYVRDRQGADWRLARHVRLTYRLHNSRLYEDPGAVLPRDVGAASVVGCKQSWLRYLTQLDVSTYAPDGTETNQPPITFDYNWRINTTPDLIPPGQDPMPSATVNWDGFGQQGTSGRVVGGALSDLLDIDGDGVRDYVSVREQAGECQLSWRRGILKGGYEWGERRFPLPTAAWYEAWKGTAAPGVRAREGCTLSGQIAYRDYPAPALGAPDATALGKGVVSYHFIDYTGDGLLDLVTNVWATTCHATYDPWAADKDVPEGDLCAFATPLQAAGAASAQEEPPEPPVGSSAFTPMTPEGGEGVDSSLYPYNFTGTWRLYEGTGDPDSPFKTQRHEQHLVRPPVPLPPSASDERLDETTFVTYSIPPLFDLDGDGYLDMIQTEDTFLTDCENELPLRECDWTVYLGDGTGEFPGKLEAYVWHVPEDILSTSVLEEDTCVLPYVRGRANVVDLRDVTGDGLADLVVQDADGVLKYYLNWGVGFQSGAQVLGPNTPLEKTQTDCNQSGNGDLTDGARGYLRRLVDLDGDGLLDMLWFANGDSVMNISAEHRAYARFNVGGRFGETGNLPEEWLPGKRLLNATYTPDEDNPFAGSWHVETDFTDVSGDGLPDLVEWDNIRFEYISSPGLPAASDLLSAVDNGRGMRIEFDYAPTSDADIVRRTTEEGGGTHLPSVGWVVREVRVDGGFESPTVVTRYRYDDPHYLSASAYTGFVERSQFAGFDTVTKRVHQADGSVTRRVRREYDYAALNPAGVVVRAPNGYVSTERVYHREGGTERLHQYTEYRTAHEFLFNGEVQTTLPVRTLTCTTSGPGMSADDCLAQTDNVHRVEETWVGIAPSTWEGPPVICDPEPCEPQAAPPELFVRAQRVVGSGSQAGAGDRRTTYHYEVRYGQDTGDTTICPLPPPLTCPEPAEDDYRVQVKKTERGVADGSLNYTRVGQKETEYGVVTGLPIKTRMWLDGDTEAVTTRAHDGDTGNLLRVTKPTQQPSAGGSGARTVFEYDSHEVSVSRTTNELGHQVLKTYDVATGALLERQGPNFVTLPTDEILWERETWQIDGFGRVLSHAISLDDQYGGYIQRTVDRMTYDDWAFLNTGQPNTIRTERLRDFDLADQDLGSAAAHGGAWVTTEQALDGLGRVLRSSQLLGGGLAADTTYEYDDRGNLVAIEVPDPRDDGARVRYAYAYDDLGRLTTFTRPDACGSGVSITYGGLEQTIAEATCDGSGGSRTKVFDAFGRLIELHEHDPAGPTAVTRYQYDANDNLAEIVDADGNVTQLTHDWLENRIAITRGARTWQYAYDLNGNLLEEIPPLPAGAEPDLYTTAYAYDDLDRVTAVSFADVQIEAHPSGGGSPVDPDPRLDHQVYLPVILTGTSPADPAPWQVSERITNTIQYGYDDGPNGLGRLHQVTLPFGEIQYTYDARGLVVSEQRSAALDDIASLDVTQSVERDYNALGQLTLSTWDDGEQWRISYDARGLVDTVEWFDLGASAWQQVADYERLLAGLSHTRGTSYGQVRAFTYDVLGRPATDSVTLTDDGGAVIADRAYSYTDSGDLAAVTGQTNGVPATATYTYDAFHRLLSASGPSGYQGTFTYSPAGNVLTADVTWNGSNETRQVSYAYGAVDPQAVDRLTEVVSGNTYAEFEYDQSGNMVTRNTPTGEMALTWDGLDQIRMAQGPDGSEVYLYDQSGARMLAISQQDGVRFWFGESETHYTLTGEQTRRYLHLSGGGPALARVENGTELELQYADTLQNLMFSLDTDGSVVASFVYGPFGEVVDQTGADDHRRQFNGKESDAATGLRYYGYRYYDPVALRWNSADPLYRIRPDLSTTEPQRLNMYSFCLNNPVRYFDPDGQDAADALRSPNQQELSKISSLLSLGDQYRGASGSLMRSVSQIAYNEAVRRAADAYGIDTSNVRTLRYVESSAGEGHTDNLRNVTIHPLSRFNYDIIDEQGTIDIKNVSLGKMGAIILHEAVHADQIKAHEAAGRNKNDPILSLQDEVQAWQIVIENASVLGLTEEEKEDVEQRRDKYITALQDLKENTKAGERGAREREVRRSWYDLE